jgi:hypothetical protein
MEREGLCRGNRPLDDRAGQDARANGRIKDSIAVLERPKLASHISRHRRWREELPKPFSLLLSVGRQDIASGAEATGNKVKLVFHGTYHSSTIKQGAKSITEVLLDPSSIS